MAGPKCAHVAAVAKVEKSRPARVYKRWVVVSSAVTLLFAWLFFPLWFSAKILPKELAQLSELVFESALFRLIPAPRIFGDELVGNLTSILRPFWVSEYEAPLSPGSILRKEGAKAHFPVVMIPGITSTGLELWEGKACATSYFRQRLWGTLAMLRILLMDRECWMEHMRLNVTTGDDPDNIKLRAAQGLEAADFILPGFWVWARIIENLAEIGYDQNSLQMAAFDWRLDFEMMEKRDHYFTRLKATIELLVHTQGRKVVIITHSMGGIVLFYFMKWVEADLSTSVIAEGVVGGRGGAGWVDRHIQSFVNVAAPFLGVPKSLSSVISGEMRDTAQLGKLESYVLEMFLSKRERVSMFRTWGGGFSMLPKGGDRIWGDGGLVADTEVPAAFGFVNLNTTSLDAEGFRPVYTADHIPEILDGFLPPPMVARIKKMYSLGISDPLEIESHDHDPRFWSNPLESRLPNAPNLQIYCFYGIGKETERAYHYRVVPFDDTTPFNVSDTDELRKLYYSVDVKRMIIPMHMDVAVQDLDIRLYTGIYHVDGDGTVPLVSNGYMCAHAWKHFPHLNPANLTVVTKEFLHDPLPLVTAVRGGPKTSDHVDILGNHELTLDILRIAANFPADREPTKIPEDQPVSSAKGPIVGDRILSKILEIARRINLDFF